MNFEEYILKVTPNIKSIISRWPGLKTDADDIRQEVYIILFKNWNKIQNHPNPTAYAVTVAKNVCHTIERLEHKSGLHASIKTEVHGDFARQEITEMTDPWFEKQRRWWRNYYWRHREECRERSKQYAKEHKEQLQEYAHKYAQTHKEKLQQYAREYYDKHREEMRQKARDKYHNDPKRREQVKKYNETHKEQIRQQKREYRQKHREEVKAKERRYYQEHREEILARQRARYKARREEKKCLLSSKTESES